MKRKLWKLSAILLAGLMCLTSVDLNALASAVPNGETGSEVESSEDIGTDIDEENGGESASEDGNEEESEVSSEEKLEEDSEVSSEESSEDNTEENSEADSEKAEEDSEVSTEEDSEENGEDEKESEDVSEKSSEETEDCIEGEDVELFENNKMEEVELAEMNGLTFSETDIAHGNSNNVSWVIDKNGKLTISGTGNWEWITIEDSYVPPWYKYADKIVSATVDLSECSDLHSMFRDCENLVTIDLNKLNTQGVMDMSCMFDMCNNLNQLDVSRFNTSSVRNMTNMFAGCWQLEYVDVSNFDTSNVRDMSAMFWASEKLKDIDVSNFDTSNVQDMECMFGCTAIEQIDVSNFDTSNVQDMSEMFMLCTKLKKLDLNNFDTSNVTDMGNMFCYSGLTSLDVRGFDTSKVTSMRCMFLECGGLKSLDLENFDTGNVTDMEGIFSGCDSLTTIQSPRNVSCVVELPISEYTTLWYRSDTGKTTTIIPQNLSKSITLTRSDATISNGYSITYDLRGGRFQDGISYPTSYEKGKSVTFKSPVRDGYKFSGWYDASTNKKVTSVKGKNISIYAKWTIVKYKITFNLNSGSFPKGTAKPTNYTVEDKTITLPTPERKYYHFMGWYEDKNFTKPATSIPAGSFGNKTFYAKWEGQGYTFTFHSNNDQNLTFQQEFIYGKKANLLSADYMEMFKYGYKFNGWTVTVNGKKKTLKDKQAIQNFTTEKGKNFDLYANWQEITYTIVYKPNGGSGKVKNTSVKGTSSVKLQNNTFKRKGFTPDGWVDQYGRKYADGQEVKELTSADKVCIVMYANWKENSYSVRFDANGGTLKAGSPAPAAVTVKYTETFVLPECPYEKEGYVCKGWNTKANGKGKDYPAPVQVKQLSSGADGESIVFYPKWESINGNALTIVYRAGDKESAGDSATMATTVMKSTKSLPACKFTKAGYKFAGWNVSKDGDSLGKSFYKDKEKITWDNSYKGKKLILTAKWEAIPYTITFDANNGTKESAIAKTYYYYDEIRVENLGFTNPDGLVFAGWNTKADGKGQSYAKDSVKKVDEIFAKGKTSVVLYMKWEPADVRKANMYRLKQLCDEGKLTHFTVDAMEAVGGTSACDARHNKADNYCPHERKTKGDACCNCELALVANTDWFIRDILGLTRDEFEKMGGVKAITFPLNPTGLSWSCNGFAEFAMWYSISGGELSKKVKGKKTVSYNNIEDIARAVKPGDFIRNGSGHSMVVVDTYKNSEGKDVILIMESNGLKMHKDDKKSKCEVHYREITQMVYSGGLDTEEKWEKYISSFGSSSVNVVHIVE